MIGPYQKPFLQDIADPLFAKAGIQAILLRLDVIHPGISGNKWYKLKYNIEEAVAKQHNTILTFGGAYSNHIHAASIAASSAELKSIGVIRGERVEPLNPTLQDAEANGMILHFVSRTKYRERIKNEFIQELEAKFGRFYLIPEGGTNNLAIKGASEILDEIQIDFDYIITAVGTGGTVAGLISGLNGKKKVIGMPILKGDFLRSDVENLVFGHTRQHFDNWDMINEYHIGGYAKFSKDLITFINNFKTNYGVTLDPIYTGKMMFGLYDLISKHYFPTGSKIIALHTGGLQGIRGFNVRFGNLIH
jgi:1-aminocyclopropane-1-carboxylate deaminase/D-cysteine desulfhydrase-like pyridoxal-dependent ACC family enzyme